MCLQSLLRILLKANFQNLILSALILGLSIQIPRPAFIGKATESYPFPFSGYVMLPGVAAHTLNPSSKSVFAWQLRASFAIDYRLVMQTKYVL